jgi:hypothetical protein
MDYSVQQELETHQDLGGWFAQAPTQAQQSAHTVDILMTWPMIFSVHTPILLML